MAVKIFNFQIALIVMIIFMGIDLTLNAVVQGVGQPILLSASLFAIQLICIVGVLVVQFIIISQTMYLKAGNWSNVFKISIAYIVACSAHFLCIVGMGVFRMVCFCCLHLFSKCK